MEPYTFNAPVPKFEWLHDGQIVVFTGTDSSRVAIDTWFEMTYNVIMKWPEGSPCLMLHDFSDKRMTVTPYSRARTEELYRLRPELQAFLAVVLPKAFGAQLLQLLIRTQVRGNWQSRIFRSRQAGIEWLELAAEFTVQV